MKEGEETKAECHPQHYPIEGDRGYQPSRVNLMQDLNRDRQAPWPAVVRLPAMYAPQNIAQPRGQRNPDELP